MNQKLTNLIDRAKHPRDRNLRNHLYIFLICCGISLFIWFLIKMSDEYVAEINMPVQYQNVPSDKLLVRADDHVSIRLQANGGDIFSLMVFSGRGALNVNLNQADVKRSRYFDRYYILTNQLFKQVSDRLDFAHNVISLHPDTLYLDFEEIITRSVPVKAMLQVDCRPEYQIYDSIVLLPTEIMVSGPSSAIDTLTFIPTVFTTLNNLDKTEETTLSLFLPVKDNKITYSHTEVKLVVPIEKFTESTIELPVKGSSDDTEIMIRTFPESVNITYQVAIKDYNLVKPELFELSVFYETGKDIEKNFLKVRIDKSPEYIRITRINPDRLEYIIQK